MAILEDAKMQIKIKILISYTIIENEVCILTICHQFIDEVVVIVNSFLINSST